MPLLAFRNLILVYYGYTELINIFYEIVFISLVFYIFHLFNLTNKKFLKISFKDEDITALLIIASLCVLWGLYLDSVLLAGDAVKLITAGAIPSANTLDYWLYIFTNSVHGHLQYRPISFFAIFYLIRNMFGPVVWPFQFLGMILMILGGKLFFNLIREISKSYFIALVGSCFLICHLSVIHMMTRPALVEKYFFPLVVLIFGLLLVKKNFLNRIVYCLALVFLSVISIMSHEGSFVFPIVFILFDFSLYKTVRKQYFLLAIPSAVYFFARWFYFKVSNTGIMKVDLLTSIKYLPTYLDHILVPPSFF